MYNLVGFRILYNHLHHNSRTLYHPKKKHPTHLQSIPIFPHPPALKVTNLLPIARNVPVLHIVYKEITQYMAFCEWIFFHYDSVFKVLHPCCNMLGISCFFMAISISFGGYTMLNLSIHHGWIFGLFLPFCYYE